MLEMRSSADRLVALEAKSLWTPRRATDHKPADMWVPRGKHEEQTGQMELWAENRKTRRKTVSSIAEKS